MQKHQISFGAHTMSHPLLGFIKDTKELKWEIQRAISVLEEVTGKKCFSFAYPFGDENSYSDPCVNILKDTGIKVAFTTLRGGNKPGCDPFRLHRFIVQNNSWYLFKIQLSGLLDG
jgi:peptidoglycan/xylan/chitin deacetylase (PgdA/CDA1 family)